MTRDSSRALIGPVAAPAMHVMTLNIRRRTRGVLRRADAWSSRAPRLRALLHAEQPVLLGAQEALPDQAAFVARALGDRYGVVGTGRGPRGDGEQCPIFYDRDRLDLEGWAQTALSDRPDAPGSRSWGNLIPRVLVAATLRDRTTGASMLALNTHFDHLSARSRLRAALAVRERAEASLIPVIVTGDLNAGPSTPPLRALLAGGALSDAWDVATVRASAEWGTFPDYRAPRSDGRRIDGIFVSHGVAVERVAINPRRHGGGWASDHLPVQAVVVVPTGEPA